MPLTSVDKRGGQRLRTRAVGQPLMTIPASKRPAGVACPWVAPFIDDYQIFGTKTETTRQIDTQCR